MKALEIKVHRINKREIKLSYVGVMPDNEDMTITGSRREIENLLIGNIELWFNDLSEHNYIIKIKRVKRKN